MAILRNIFSILDKHQRLRMIFIFFSMIFLTFLEVLSIGLIIPIATIFSNIDNLMDNNLFERIYVALNKPSQIMLFFYSVCLFFLSIILKSIFSIFIIWSQARFSFDLMKNFSERIFKKYLNKSWEFHLESNSSILFRNITDETSLVANTVIMSLLVFINQVFLITGIFIFLIYFEPFGTMIVFLVLSLVAWFYQKSTKKRQSCKKTMKKPQKWAKSLKIRKNRPNHQKSAK